MWQSCRCFHACKAEIRWRWQCGPRVDDEGEEQGPWGWPRPGFAHQLLLEMGHLSPSSTLIAYLTHTLCCTLTYTCQQSYCTVYSCCTLPSGSSVVTFIHCWPVDYYTLNQPALPKKAFPNRLWFPGFETLFCIVSFSHLKCVKNTVIHSFCQLHSSSIMKEKKKKSAIKKPWHTWLVVWSSLDITESLEGREGEWAHSHLPAFTMLHLTSL